MTADLKPCPFCGSTQVEPIYSSWEFYSVDCAKCHTSGPRADLDEVFVYDHVAAVKLACERWNRRAEAGVCGSVPPVTHTHRPSGSVCKAYHEQVVADLTAERDRERADFDHLKAEWNRACAVAQQHCPTPLGKSMLFDGIPALAQLVKELEAEVERLKAELSNQECDTAFWKERAEKFKAEVERLCAHTWEEERQAIIQFAMASLSSVNIGDLKFFRKLVNDILCNIEQGKHWPVGGDK